jgi:tetratricopeptide (TPR) repeat protein
MSSGGAAKGKGKAAGKNTPGMKEDPRFRRGRALLQSRRYEDAVEFFGELLEIKANQYGEMDPRVSLAYLEYGNALFMRAQEEEGGFQFDDEADGEGSAEGSVSAEGAGEAEGEEGDAKCESKGEADGEGAEEGGGEGKEQHEGEQQQEGEMEETDMALAWQMLEVARVLYSKRGGAHQYDLSRVHMKLADHSMHRKLHADAIEDYQKALDIRKKALDASDSRIADAHVSLATAFLESGESIADCKGGDDTHIKEASEQAAEHTRRAANIVNSVAGKRVKTEHAAGSAERGEWAAGASSKGKTEAELEDLRAISLLVENVKTRVLTLAGRKRQADGTFK